MNNEDIIKAREKYKLLEQQRKKLIELKNKMDELGNNDSVREYIDLCNQLNLLSEIKIPTNGELIFNAFNDIATRTNNPCNVYLYLGLKEEQKHSYQGTPYSLTFAERRIYKNLDTGFVFDNYAYKKDIFETNNQIINCFGTAPDERFNEIRNEYFFYLLKYDSEEAIQKTFSKNKK